MDFSFSDEQRQLKDSVDRFVREQYEFANWRRIVTSESGYSQENWEQMAELGWLGVAIPEDYDGLGGTPIDTMVIMEGFGRGMVAEPYLTSVVLAGGLLAQAGSDEQKRALLPKLAAGTLKLAFAYAEPQSRFNLADVEVTAKPDGSGWILDGRKSVVYYAAGADKIILTARTAGGSRDAQGISLFLLDRGAAGVTCRDYRTVDHRRASDLTFEGARVDGSALLGPKDGALPLVELAVDHAIAASAAEAVGAMQVLHDSTNEYLKTRKQFGVPIGSFQALQHRMVDMLIALEQARSLTYMATMKLAEPDPAERARAVAAAKTMMGQSGRFVGQQAVQLHGGMGMSDELNIGHYMKRLMMLDMLFGNADHHRRRFADLG